MCNLYSLTKGPQAIRDFTRAMRSGVGNMPPLPGIFPDYPAPIVRNAANGRELVMARWGMPSPVIALKGRSSDPGVTNIRNVASPHWGRWLGVESRCAVPFSSFSENEHLPDGSRPPVWFAFDESRPVAFFAGLWTRWTSVRRVKEGETTNDLFGFLTTDPNAEVKAIHPKTMPVILTTRAEVETWLTALTKDALALQRPLPDGALEDRGARRSNRRRGRIESASTLGEKSVLSSTIGMVTISISDEAYRAIAGHLTHPSDRDDRGGYRFIVDHRTLDRVRAMRGAGECYSDVILRLEWRIKKPRR